MRTLKVKLAMLATLMLLPVTYSVGAPSPQQDKRKMASMTVAELEKAADAARTQKDYALAIDYFQSALRKDRKNFKLYNKMGLTELKNGDENAARVDFERAVKLNSKFADAVNNLGAVDYLKKNYGSAAKYFKKAVALDESRAAFHVNLGAAWFAQKKVDRAVAEYSRAVELDPDALRQDAKAGVVAQVSTPEQRAQYSYMMAKIYAQHGDLEDCLQCLKKAKEEGYRDLAKVYKDEEFSQMRDNPRLQEVVPPPTPK